MRGYSFPDADMWRLAAYVRTFVSKSGTENQAPAASALPPPDPVSYEDLLRAGELPDRWITYSGSYDSHRLSTASQITPANVSGLRLLWMHQFDANVPRLETSPLVLGDYMFVTISSGEVAALDVRTGDLIWAYYRPLPEKLPNCCGSVNRGLAARGDKLFLGTLDAHLVALDLRTGKLRWDVEVADYKKGYGITGAPLALRDSVITGVAGGEFGTRGFVEAHDLNTGRRLWRFNTIPEPGQPGSETWQGNSWKLGGGPTWLTGSFDPALNLIYWSVGNPSPEFSGDSRSGDNLYTNSVVALDANSGALKWHFQFTPHDEFDWDATEIVVLLKAKLGDREQSLLAQADRNGFYYVLDAASGKFVAAAPFVKQNWAERIDTNGRPVEKAPLHPTSRGIALYPSVLGGTNWYSPSYNPVTNLMYVPAIEQGGLVFAADTPYRAGNFFLGGEWQPLVDQPRWVAVRALNPVNGERQWEYRTDAFTTGGLLSTATGVLFGSHGSSFFALDARSGHELWKLNTGASVAAAPITVLHQGQQLVVVAAGRDLLAFGL